MKIYNTLTRRKEEFVPISSGKVGMYVCGPTVYGMPHVGHAKSYINFDIVHRTFKKLGFKVKYVQNITDVGHLVGDGDEGEDKIAKQARIEMLDPYEIAYKYEVEYFDAMDKLNVLRPSISCRATGFIPEIIDAVQEIIDKGYGYVTKEGNVYFDVHALSSYGMLSNRTLDKTLSGERIEVADDKKHPEDFALWKAVEPNTLMKWKSPWGVGCPGWHIECSVLGRKFLGEQFDIHGGGIDNLFPHHECECAQGRVLTGNVPMHYFMHNNLVTVNGTKMGKSLGNFITLKDLFAKYDPMVVRYFIVQFHYRSAVDFNEDGLVLAKKQFEKFEELASNVRKLTKDQKMPTGELEEIYSSSLDALQDDFNTPVVIAQMLKFAKISAPLVSKGDKEKAKEANFIIKNILKDVLGLVFKEEMKKEEDIPQEVKDLAEKRMQAKKNKDYALSDDLRTQISQMGFVVIDTKDGFELKKK